jgi:hypothetical protein
MKSIYSKKLFFLFLAFTWCTQFFAQPLVPNGGFESWENFTFFNAPDDWISSPMMDGSYFTVIKVDDDASDGTMSTRLLTISDGDGGIDDGMVLIGDFSQGINGALWNTPVDKLHLSVKHSVQQGDAFFIMVNLYKEGQIIGRTLYAGTGSEENWTPLSLPIVFENPEVTVPDRMFLAIVSSYPGDEIPEELVGPGYNPSLYTATAGTWLMVDDVYFTLGASTDKILVSNHSFENWFNVAATQPTGWGTNVLNYFGTPDEPVTKSTDAFVGDFAARLEVISQHEGAELYLGDRSQGIAFTEKPQAIAFAYKFIPSGNDNAHLQVAFHGQDDGNYQDYWQGAWVDINTPAAEYTEAFAQIFYGKGNTFTPERLLISVYGGNNEGSVLLVDNVRFVDLRNISLLLLNDDTNNPIPNALVTISGIQNPMFSQHNGQIDLQLPDGTYNYTIAAQGYVTKTGSFTVTDQSGFINIRVDPFIPDPNSFIIEFVDGDEDNVYFDGDNFGVNVKLPANVVAPNGTTVELVQYLFADDLGSSEPYTVFADGTLSAGNVMNGSFNITGQVTAVAKLGVIGFGVTLNVPNDPGPGFTPVNAGIIPVFDTYLYNPDLSDYRLAFVGFALPSDAGVTIHPDFSDISILYGWGEPVQVTMTKEGMGSIQFMHNLNWVDNRNQFTNIRDGIHISASTTDGFYAELDPFALPFLSGRMVKISLFNIPAGIDGSEIEVYRTNFGTEPQEWDTPVSPMNPNLTEGVFSFEWYGFSRYTLVHPGLTVVTNNAMVGAGDIKVFPNPANDEITIISHSDISSITITDLRGMTVLKMDKAVCDKVNISSLSPGLYIVMVDFIDGKSVKQMLHKR